MSEDVIQVYGHDLVTDIIGQWSFTDLVFAAMTGGTRPTPSQARMTEALLTTFVDHGVTPSSLATRLTLLGSPEAMQAAIAAGICGAGSRYLGTMQSVGEMLVDTLAEEPNITNAAAGVVERSLATKSHIPGLGHPEHKSGDPRTPKLIELAHETGCFGQHCQLLLAVAEEFALRSGRNLPVNAAGLAGAIVVDMGLPPIAGRGLAIIARTAGLAGVVLSEIRTPTAQKIWDDLR